MSAGIHRPCFHTCDYWCGNHASMPDCARRQGTAPVHADSEDVQKAQLGCVDCLAALVGVQLGAAHGSAPAAAEQEAPAAPAAALYPGLVIEEADGHAQAPRGGERVHLPSSPRLLVDELVDALSWRR